MLCLTADKSHCFCLPSVGLIIQVWQRWFFWTNKLGSFVLLSSGWEDKIVLGLLLLVVRNYGFIEGLGRYPYTLASVSCTQVPQLLKILQLRAGDGVQTGILEACCTPRPFAFQLCYLGWITIPSYPISLHSCKLGITIDCWSSDLVRSHWGDVCSQHKAKQCWMRRCHHSQWHHHCHLLSRTPFRSGLDVTWKAASKVKLVLRATNMILGRISLDKHKFMVNHCLEFTSSLLFPYCVFL